MKAFLVATLLLVTTPAFALPGTLEEAAAIETACNGIELGAEQCACIATDAIATLDEHMREIVLMSMSDVVGFDIRVKGGEFPNEDIDNLNAYQQYVQDKCAPGATEG